MDQAACGEVATAVSNKAEDGAPHLSWSPRWYEYSEYPGVGMAKWPGRGAHEHRPAGSGWYSGRVGGPPGHSAGGICGTYSCCCGRLARGVRPMQPRCREWMSIKAGCTRSLVSLEMR